MQQPSKRGARLQYIDALRGISILLVVLHHVINKMGPVMAHPSALAMRDTLASFRLPLFFFLSGYFAYRASDKWSRDKLKSVFSKKLQAQLLGTAVFASAYFYCFHQDIAGGLAAIGATRYWFAIALFQMFAIYILLMLCTRHARSDMFTWLLIAVTVIIYGIHLIITRDHYCIELCNEADRAGWGKLSYYFPFFAFGILARKAGYRLFRLIENRNFTLALVSTFFISILFINDMDFSTTGKLLYLIPGFTGVLTLFALFYRSREYFDSDKRLPRLMAFTGRRTLDIYYLHYFFVPDLAFIPITFYLQNPVLPLLAIGLTASCGIVALSLLLSATIRVSPRLSSFLFASK